MATYVTHLRIADKIYDNLKIRDSSLFFIGCIAPDTDVPPDQSHCCINGDKTTCNTDQFFKKYIENKLDRSGIDFFIGYYVHLLTDVLWHMHKIDPIKQCSKNAIKSIKQAWRNIDNDFLCKSHDFRPIIMMQKATPLNWEWFSNFPVEKIKALTDDIIIAKGDIADSSVDPDVKKEIDQFIDDAAFLVMESLSRKGL